MIVSRMLIGIEMEPLVIRVQPDGPQVAVPFKGSLPLEFWQSYLHRYSLWRLYFMAVLTALMERPVALALSQDSDIGDYNLNNQGGKLLLFFARPCGAKTTTTDAPRESDHDRQKDAHRN